LFSDGCLIRSSLVGLMMGVSMATLTSASGADRVEAEINRVPDPLPLTIGGMIAAVGPQAINFGISIGGGEAYLLPNVAARGALGWHWLMVHLGHCRDGARLRMYQV
jgi:hypothetical protein